MRIEPQDYHAVARRRRRRSRRRSARSQATGSSGSGGLQGLAAEPPPPRAIVVGHRWDPACTRAAALPRPQPDHVRLDPPDAPDADEAWGGPLPAEDDLPGDPGRRRQDRGAPDAPPGCRVARSRHRAGRGRVRRGDRRRRPGGARRRPSTGPRRACARSWSSGRRRAARRARRRGSRTTSASPRASRATSWRAARCSRRGGSGAEILVTRTITRSIRRRARCTSTAATSSARGRSSSPAASRGDSSRSRDSNASPGKGIFYGAAASEAPSTHGLDVHIVGAGNSAGQAAIFFSNHARSVTILCRGEGLEKSMSRYLSTSSPPRRTSTCSPGREVVAAHGDDSLEAIEVRDSDDRRDHPTGVGRALHLHRRRRRDGAGCQRRSRSTVMASCSPARTCSAAGRWELDRDPYLLETSVPGSSPAATSAQRRSSASPPPSARAAWRSPSCTSTCVRPPPNRSPNVPTHPDRRAPPAGESRAIARAECVGGYRGASGRPGLPRRPSSLPR